MAVFYQREKSKLGTLTGTIINFSLEMTEENDPSLPLNRERLPAGYLRCDGAVLSADDFPALASVLGTGSQCKFRKTNQDLADDQFQLPDLRQKHIRATSSSNIGLYNDLTVTDVNGNTVIKAGVGMEVFQRVPSPYEIPYTGSFFLPSQSLLLRGEPGFTRTTGSYTSYSEVLQNQMQPHLHFSTTTRARQRDRNGNDFSSPGQNWELTRSSLEICRWFYNTRQDLCYYYATSLVATDSPENASCGINGSFQNWGLCWTGCDNFLSSGWCLWPSGPTEFPCDDITTEFGFTSGDGGGCPNYNDPFKSTTIGNITYDGTYSERCVPNILNFGSCVGGKEPNDKAISTDGVSGTNWSFATVPFLQVSANPDANDAFGAVQNITSQLATFGNDARHRHSMPFNSDEPHTYTIITEPVNIQARATLESSINISVNESRSADEYIQPYIISEYLIKT